MRLVIALAVGLAFACGGANARKQSDNAIVFIDCPVKDASLWVDGRYLRPIRDVRGGVAVSPGKTHFIEIKHDGYHTFYKEVTLGVRERTKIVVRLAEVLP